MIFGVFQVISSSKRAAVTARCLDTQTGRDGKSLGIELWTSGGDAGIRTLDTLSSMTI